MSVTEVKQGLRKTDFPVCARDALARIEHLLSGKTPSIKNMDLAIDLMAEFVFCEVDRRGTKRSPLTALQQLQLLEVLCDFFASSSGEAIKNSVFLSLFSATTAVQRSSVLCKLVSIAISVPFASLLTSAGTWMQQLGNTSGHSHKLAKALIMDYFVLVPNAMTQLQELPHIAPQFTANFLTALADIYYVENKGNIEFPSSSLLKTITSWLTNNGKLCIAAQQTQSCLPTGAIAMEAITPYAGLLKWTVLAPIYNQNDELYTKLHAAVLHSLLFAYSGIGPPKAVSAAHLSNPIGLLLKYAGNHNSQDEALQISLNRYAQAIQISISSNCVYGNVSDFFAQLQQLPYNRLLLLVTNKHRQKI